MNKIQKEIIALKEEKNALILAHNYQSIEVQELADFRGDSLQLSIQSAQTHSSLIVFAEFALWQRPREF
jgi:quinolinate synthase